MNGHRRLPVCRTVLWLLPSLLMACGQDEAPGRSAPGPSKSDESVAPDRERGEREEISSADEALQRAQRLDPRDVVLQVGAKAPGFAGYPEKSRAVIVFFRGEWWPPCRRQLGELQDHLAQIEAAGARLVVVSADEQADLDSLRQRFGLTFPMVSDPQVKIAEAYGVRQKDRDVALPATFIAGADRMISFVHVAKNPVDRLATVDLLAALGKRH